MAVRAKFQVQKVAKVSWSPTAVEITMGAMWDDGIEENARFAKATPSGTFTMLVDNPPAAEQLELGKFFYLDLTPA